MFADPIRGGFTINYIKAVKWVKRWIMSTSSWYKGSGCPINVSINIHLDCSCNHHHLHFHHSLQTNCSPKSYKSGGKITLLHKYLHFGCFLVSSRFTSKISKLLASLINSSSHSSFAHLVMLTCCCYCRLFHLIVLLWGGFFHVILSQNDNFYRTAVILILANRHIRQSIFGIRMQREERVRTMSGQLNSL